MAAATPGEVNNGEVDGPRRRGHPPTPVDHPTTVETPLSGSFYFIFFVLLRRPSKRVKGLTAFFNRARLTLRLTGQATRPLAVRRFPSAEHHWPDSAGRKIQNASAIRP